MLVADSFSLPDTFFLAAVILAVLTLLAVAIGLHLFRSKSQGAASQILFLSVILLAGTLICLLNASIVITPKGKITAVSSINDNNNDLFSEGLNFKLPWEKANTYDDVITISTDEGDKLDGFSSLLSSKPLRISGSPASVYSHLAKKQVDDSYMLANQCIDTLKNLLKTSQPALDEFLCQFGDESFLIRVSVT